MEEKREIWERIEDESEKAYEAFCAYRDMGTQRSLAKVSEKLGKNISLIARWNKENSWQERVKAWDTEQEKKQRESLLHGALEMRERHAEAAKEMFEKAMTALRETEISDLKPKDIIAMLEASAKLERMSRTEPLNANKPEENAGDEERIDLSELTDEELAKLNELTEKIAQ